MSTVKTISEYIASLPTGTDPLVAALYIASTRRERHEARVAAVIDAATDYVAAEPARLAAVLALEIHGVGGPMGLGGPDGATGRMSWARRLGKGRRFASDGGAWSAAIEAALYQVRTSADQPAGGFVSTTTVGGLIGRAESAGDLLWVATYALHRALQLRSDVSSATAWAEVARTAVLASEPESEAAALGARYGLVSGPRIYRDTYRATARLREETATALIREFFGCWDAEIDYPMSHLTADGMLRMQADRDGTIPVGSSGPDDPAIRISMSGPDCNHPTAIASIQRAWGWRAGQSDEDGVMALHAVFGHGAPLPDVD